MDIQSSGVKPAQKKSRVGNIRVDLTPMVDLGFLLITFFVFTNTMAHPTAMNLVMPNDKQAPGDIVCESCVLTLLLSGNNVVKYYEGMPGERTAVRETSFYYQGIRDLIVRKKALIRQIADSTKQLVLIIKSDTASTFQNFVDVIDEVAINNVRHYYLSPVDETDKKVFGLHP